MGYRGENERVDIRGAGCGKAFLEQTSQTALGWLSISVPGINLACVHHFAVWESQAALQ